MDENDKSYYSAQTDALKRQYDAFKQGFEMGVKLGKEIL